MEIFFAFLYYVIQLKFSMPKNLLTRVILKIQLFLAIKKKIKKKIKTRYPVVGDFKFRSVKVDSLQNIMHAL